jgi:peptide/nickel transport system substrate-binding protein
MRKSFKFLLVGAALALLGALAIVPVFAQDGAGQGGIIIEATFSGDPANFNPIIASDTASRRIIARIFPGFLAADPSQGVIVPVEAGNPLTSGALVTGWDISDDGTVYTFTLRDDFTWSDGTPVTSADVVYTWNAILAGTENIVDTPLTFLVDSIASVEAPDANTVVVTFTTAECTALNYAASLAPVPSHVLPADLTLLNDDPFNLAPSVSGGPFVFGEIRPSELVSLLPNQAYPDASLGFVSPEGFIYKQVPDQTVVVEQFLAGETNVIDNAPVNRRSDIDAAVAAGDRQDFRFPGTAWDYLALNLGDPNNPQNGADEDGNPIPQGNHPLFGDVRVRQAIALAVDVDAIVQAALFGEGDRMTSFIIPASWAYNTELPPIAVNLEAAGALLDEAGFIDDDSDPSTPRVAQGAMYAPDGTPLRFTLFSNQGNSRREAVGTLVQDQLSQIGIQVDFQTIDFNTQLDIMDSQTFDAFILGWRNGYPDDPDATQLFTPVGDVVGGGSNDVSYYNAEFVELNSMAKNALGTNGCDVEVRREMYWRMQEIFQNDLPYIPLFTIGGHYAADASLSPWTPYGGGENLYWNIDQWAFATSAP